MWLVRFDHLADVVAFFLKPIKQPLSLKTALVTGLRRTHFFSGPPPRAHTISLQTFSVVAIAPESGHTSPLCSGPGASGRRSLPAFAWERLRI
jgi:hypothetical protein